MSSVHPKQSPPGRAGNRYCECGRCLDGKTEEAIKRHEETALHKRWLQWSEHQENMRTKHNERNKEYRQTDAYKESQQKRVERDRETGWARQKEYNSRRYDCPCGCNIRRGNLYEHQKTKKHIRLMEQKAETNNVFDI